MELYFLRHGIAAERGPAGTGDAGRPLTPEGIEKMTRAARGMRQLGLELDVLVSSPFVRARETAEIVGRELRIDVQFAPQLAVGCDLAQLRSIAALRSGVQRAMVVGHESDLSIMISELTGGSEILMKKGGLARVDLYSFDTSGVLVWLLTSSVLRAAGAAATHQMS